MHMYCRQKSKHPKIAAIEPWKSADVRPPKSALGVDVGGSKDSQAPVKESNEGAGPAQEKTVRIDQSRKQQQRFPDKKTAKWVSSHTHTPSVRSLCQDPCLQSKDSFALRPLRINI